MKFEQMCNIYYSDLKFLPWLMGKFTSTESQVDQFISEESFGVCVCVRACVCVCVCVCVEVVLNS